MLQKHRFITEYYKQKNIATPTLAITQPRRLPCLSLAQRVSEEMGVALGREVGYAVRFDSKETLASPGSKKNGQTTIRFCTEGVLLRYVRLAFKVGVMLKAPPRPTGSLVMNP